MRTDTESMEDLTLYHLPNAASCSTVRFPPRTSYLSSSLCFFNPNLFLNCMLSLPSARTLFSLSCVRERAGCRSCAWSTKAPDITGEACTHLMLELQFRARDNFEVHGREVLASDEQQVLRQPQLLLCVRCLACMSLSARLLCGLRECSSRGWSLAAIGKIGKKAWA